MRVIFTFVKNFTQCRRVPKKCGKGWIKALEGFPYFGIPIPEYQRLFSGLKIPLEILEVLCYSCVDPVNVATVKNNG